ncbi:MAG: hypothetical protein J0H78_07190 [Rhizobiales bacterium]|nr:hypothetical protein [Hyphomicrobiales bacterium]
MPTLSQRRGRLFRSRIRAAIYAAPMLQHAAQGADLSLVYAAVTNFYVAR